MNFIILEEEKSYEERVYNFIENMMDSINSNLTYRDDTLRKVSEYLNIAERSHLIHDFRLANVTSIIKVNIALLPEKEFVRADIEFPETIVILPGRTK